MRFTVTLTTPPSPVRKTIPSNWGSTDCHHTSPPEPIPRYARAVLLSWHPQLCIFWSSFLFPHSSFSISLCISIWRRWCSWWPASCSASSSRLMISLWWSISVRLLASLKTFNLGLGCNSNVIYHLLSFCRLWPCCWRSSLLGGSCLVCISRD